MKTIKTFTLIAVSVLMLSSCQKTFEEINTNEEGVTQEMGARDGIAIGGPIQAMQRQVVPVGTAADGTTIANDYQVAYHLGPDTWSGYFGQNQDWNGGSNFTTFFMFPNWLGSLYTESYTKTFQPWLTIKNSPVIEDHPEYYALAQVLKISAWHKTTDAYGPIPYTKAGTGLYVTPYDSQEVVYKSMLSDLEKAIGVLTDYAKNSASLLPDFDLVYGGNTTKWVKYANSLMLRLAMRARFADEELAKSYAEKAVKHPVGVMTAKDDQAMIGNALGIQYMNNIPVFSEQYNEARMGTPMFMYLVGFKDPRLSAYFKPSTSYYATESGFDGKSYLPYPIGWAYKDDDKDNPNSFIYASLPNINKTTPTYWMRTSEVLFLRAEGALVGWDMGGAAEDLYHQGIEMSFVENGIDVGLVSQYLSENSTPVDADFSYVWGLWHTFTNKSTITTSFEENNPELQLEQIITQKWIALYPNGMEAWSEWRRTGYPYIANAINNRSNGIVDNDKKVRRMQYPINNARSAEDQEVYDEAIDLLGGPDNAATTLWWDKKTN